MLKPLVEQMQAPLKTLTRAQTLLVGLAFNLYWLAAVWGGVGWPLLAVVLLCWWWHPQTLLTTLCWAPLGIAVDYLLYHAGVHNFGPGGFPLWLVMLWLGFVSFATLMKPLMLTVPMRWLVPVITLGGVSSYWAGHRLGAVEWPLGLTFTLALLCVIWLGVAVAMALFIRLDTNMKVGGTR